MTEALGLNSWASPIDRVPDSANLSIQEHIQVNTHSPLHCSRADVNNFRMRPIRPTSLTTPHPTNTAHTSMAEARISGVESEENAGVSAAVMGA
jgi:hypothetical protein